MERDGRPQGALPEAHGGSGGGAAAGEPRRWRRRLPARGHWGAAMEGRAAAGTPRAAGRGGQIRRLPRCLLGDQRTLGREAAGESAGDGHGATNGRPQGAARETEGRMGGQWNDWTRAEAPTRTSAGRGAKGARASAALWQRARPPR